MPDSEEKQGRDPFKWVTNAQLQLELRAMNDRIEKRFGDVKLWILGGVALNQFLGATNIPSTWTGAALGAFALKGVIAAIFRGGS